MRRMKSAPTGCRLLSHFVIGRFHLQGIAGGSANGWILVGGCRARYEPLDGRGREILVEKASEALGVEGLGECVEFHDEFGAGCAEEALVG